MTGKPGSHDDLRKFGMAINHKMMVGSHGVEAGFRVADMSGKQRKCSLDPRAKCRFIRWANIALDSFRRANFIAAMDAGLHSFPFRVQVGKAVDEAFSGLTLAEKNRHSR